MARPFPDIAGIPVGTPIRARTAGVFGLPPEVDAVVDEHLLDWALSAYVPEAGLFLLVMDVDFIETLTVH